MHMIKKKQMTIEAGDEDRTAAEQFYALAAYSPSTQRSLTQSVSTLKLAIKLYPQRVGTQPYIL